MSVEPPDYSVLILYNKMIISLLGRLVFPEEKLTSIIKKNSKKPSEIIKAYNLCTGELSITEIAKKSGLSQQALSETLVKWEKLGIILPSNSKGKGNEQNPIHLYEVNLD